MKKQTQNQVRETPAELKNESFGWFLIFSNIKAVLAGFGVYMAHFVFLEGFPYLGIISALIATVFFSYDELTSYNESNYLNLLKREKYGYK